MNFIDTKIFFDGYYQVDYFRIEQSNNYYKSVRKQVDNGYKPIIISSDLMIQILKKYFKEQKANIVDIELLEDDFEYQEEINNIIRSIRNNRDYFIDLIEELSFLSETSNIEIKRLRFKYRINQELVDISISLNGLVNYSDNKSTENELNAMRVIISDYLKGLYKDGT